MYEIIKKNFTDIKSKLDLTKSIIVQKGFSIDLENKIDIQNLFNKGLTASWFELYSSRKNIITYEEFLYFYNFIIEEYENIYIINNNIYHNFYPLDVEIPIETKLLLKDFFNDDENENVSKEQIFDGEKYTKIFSNIKKINENYFVRYNDISEISNLKIRNIDLFDSDNIQPLVVKNKNERPLDNVLFMQETEDFLYVLEKLLNNQEIYVNIDSYIGEDAINNKLQIISTYIAPITVIKSEDKDKSLQTNPKFKEILQKYWKHDSFRNLKIYNFEKIKNGIKSVEEVSQENIISDIVKQVETFKQDPQADYRDVFVTAPTGAGKSAMFLIPAMYLAEQYNLVTLVISPLIGLMNDQVSNLEKQGYKCAKTINSDISQIEKEEIMEDIKEGKCHILYLSPESLLARSDISQIIGDRKIGMIVIDEAHIVTTWGKQFRPDYWYLGDYIKKLRKKQTIEHHPFLIATFTATAIYGGEEDMYKETLNSLNMRFPITYLGYVKRDDIEIEISELKKETNKEQYQRDKFDSLIQVINRAIGTNKKLLIYFPTVKLIDSFYTYCTSKDLNKYIARYHGQMQGDDKKENAELYKNKEKLVMLATKAFGMGIDISDIEIVCHFAPTGNVCDYVQEIGRVARDPKLKGEAIYAHMSNDFQHINRLHGLSAVKKYQLIKVIQKVYELYKIKLESENLSAVRLSKKRNEMLVDAENFTYIFEGPLESSEDDLIAKVKTALLLIQKDYTSKMGFSPFAMRPSTLYAQGFFQISDEIVDNLIKRYGTSTFKLCSSKQKVYLVNLQKIWEKDYGKNYSFPNFKRLLYTSDKELENYNLNKLIPATRISVEYIANETSRKIYNAIINILRKSAYEDIFLQVESNGKKDPTKNISDCISVRSKISTFKANGIANILISTIKNYARNYSKSMNAKIMDSRPIKTGTDIYRFNRPIEDFIEWLNEIKSYISNNVAEDGKIYIVRNQSQKTEKEIITALGLLEAINYLTFEASGGLNSQIYIYVNQTKTMEEVISKPNFYNNRLLEKVADRHKISVAMLSYLYQNEFKSNEIWEYIENYFLGIVPEEVLSLRDQLSK
ncbi:MAG: DEAD/DEAH box helicase [Candidatus Gastranaerophilaceae bacterium]|nr:DEAD/DEAH box helicase [Candidatus Gastranaerophilaceae bacterium]